MAKKKHKSLTIEDVENLGSALIEVADRYPLDYLTESDFFPLVVSYLLGRVPKVTPEVATVSGKVDFRIGGTNPAVLEIAVAPRRMADMDCKDLRFPGHVSSTQLYATQNRPELNKLKGIGQSKARNRYLLLLDLRGTSDVDALRVGYEKELPPGKGGAVVRVVYVSRSTVEHFPIGGKGGRTSG